jgi:hypothetical protein
LKIVTLDTERSFARSSAVKAWPAYWIEMVNQVFHE